MAQNFKTPLHLDDSWKPLGLTVLQTIGLIPAFFSGYEAWRFVGSLPITGGASKVIEMVVGGLVASIVMAIFYLMSGDRTERYAHQLTLFAFRKHTFAPIAYQEEELDNANDTSAQTADAA